MGGEVWHKYHPLTKHRITTHPHKTAFLVTETDFDRSTCMWPVLIPILHCSAKGLFFLFTAQQRLNTHYRVSLSLLSVLSAQTAGAAQAVVDANVDHIAGEEEALGCGNKTEWWVFLLCSQDIRKKTIQQDKTRWMSLTVCLCVHLKEREREKKTSHLFTKRIMAMWPQSVWLR